MIGPETYTSVVWNLEKSGSVEPFVLSCSFGKQKEGVHISIKMAALLSFEAF
jgi:hypothetical protein